LMKNKIVKLRAISVVILCWLGFCIVNAHAWQSDNGDATFTNPPLYADYPDPDIIRVGEDFYMASTTFVNSPGLTILHSQDLVNWEIVCHVVDPLDGDPLYDMDGGTAYRHGVFAPSLRYHNGTFYVVVTPVGQNTRVYYSDDIAGPWQYHELNVGAFDPGFFIDDDGTGYIFTSGSWDGHVTVHTLNATFSSVVTTTSDVFYYDGIEGCKVIKHNGYYYVFNARPTWESQGGFWLMCSRSTDIFGSYETIINLTELTGGHQGAIVDLPDGNWYGFVMKDSGSIGRMTYISPIFWEDDWPVWGTEAAPNQVPATATKPIQDKPLMQPATTDHFCSSTLGLQWQWNHNPDNTRWSLTERPGYLRLRPTQSTGLWTARNTLTQKGQGPWSRGEVTLDLQNLQPGDICGFGTLGKYSAHIAVNCDNDANLFLSMKVLQDTTEGIETETRVASVPIESDMIMLRTDLDFGDDTGLCSYSLDGETWTSLGGEFPLAFDWQTGTFQGEQFAIFCYNPSPGTGYVDVDSFIFTDSAVAPLYGDMNGDNYVNAGDLSEFLNCWLLEDCSLDLNHNCVINLHEFAEFANNWLDDSI
jgi:beta-xylosidase